VHSEKEALAAEAASQALFGQGELTDLDPETLRTALGELPNFNCEIGISVVAALVESGLVESNGQARRAIAQGSVSVNKVKITDELALIDQYLPGKVAVLSRGKKSLAGLFFD
jgi:tyrosyl-tRNA synthetase